MHTIKNLMNATIARLLFVSSTLLLASCNEEDPFVDRTVAPVLIVFDDVTGYLAGGGLTSVPSVTKKVTASNYTDPVTLSASFYELDKSGILDHTVGIDSIPVPGLVITFSKRDGSSPVALTSDTNGKVSLTTTWEALGISDVEAIVTAPEKKSIAISLSWSGTHKGQSFTRYSQLMFEKDAD